MKTRVLWFMLTITLALLLAACGAGPSEAEVEETVIARLTAEAPTPEPPTATPEAEAPASGDEPELEVPTAEAGDPTLTSIVDLRVRSGPGTIYPIIGVLRNGAAVRIVGKSSDSFWWKIECPPGSGGECWSSAAAQFGAATNTADVSVAAAPPPPPPTATQAATAVAQTTASASASASSPSGASPTPSQTGGPMSSPTSTQSASPTTQQGQPTNTPTATATTTNATATSTSTQTASPTTQTAQEAPFDNDSLQNPARTEFLSITGTRNFSHSNDVSFPGGDQDDWVQFEFPNNSNPNQNVWITLSCSISGDPDAQLRATVYENGGQTNKIVLCNTGEQQLTVDNTKVQQARIHWGIPKDGIYATYTVTVVGFK